MEQLLTSNIGYESWIAQTEITKITEGSTAKEGITISIIKFEHKEEMPKVAILPKQEFWIGDLGSHWEFSRKEIYDQAISHRFEHSNLRPEQK
jgi:hypothetical protein